VKTGTEKNTNLRKREDPVLWKYKPWKDRRPGLQDSVPSDGMPCQYYPGLFCTLLAA
jgi:hypothetical protein